jgi:hypothetical protein
MLTLICLIKIYCMFDIPWMPKREREREREKLWRDYYVKKKEKKY